MRTGFGYSQFLEPIPPLVVITANLITIKVMKSIEEMIDENNLLSLPQLNSGLLSYENVIAHSSPPVFGKQ